ncbi:MAG: GtrA family protein [Eubacteriales bacterium]|nr:GtrA family protein [Eubacteriales bacterium]
MDFLLFTLFSKIFLSGFANRIFIATGLARVFSAIFNFCLNRNVVFQSSRKYSSAAVRYFMLCIVQALASALLVNGIFALTKLDEVIIKVIVKLIVYTALFFVSYQIQRRFIFQKGI